MSGLLNVLRSLGLVRLGTIIGVTTAVMIGLLLIILRLSTPPMSLLYSGLDYNEAGSIMERLEQQDVPYRVDGNGTMIFAPNDQVLKLRMDLAGDGLPSGGSVGYEIFDNMDALGTTSFMQNLNHLRALEGELSRTITSLASIDTARVHLVIPERSLFGQDKIEPTASIVVGARRSQIGPQQIASIQNLVSSAVPGLSPGKVSIVDNQGRLLASAASEDNEMNLAGTLQDKNSAFEDRIRRQVHDIVASVVGPQSVRVQVSAEVDFSRVVQQSEIYDPDGQVVRSTQTIEETSNDVERQSTEGVSVTNNLPEPADSNAGNARTSSNNNRLEETVNFEISRTSTTETQEAGRVQRLSVAVVVDGSYNEEADGTSTYVPRSEEEMTRITTLVKSSIGFDEVRGDTVDVLNLAFLRAEPPEEVEEAGGFMGLNKEDFMRIGEIVAAIIVGVILLLVFRTALSRAGGDGQAIETAGGARAEGEQAQLAAPAADGTQAAPQAIAARAPGAPPLPLPAPSGPQIDIAQIEGRVKEMSVKKIGELVQAHPDESIAILRSWLHEA